MDYDYIVVGSGIAGLFTALLAARHGSVVVITKGRIADTNTRFAQGGIAAAIAPEDSPELHFRDTLKAGAGLCDPEAARVLAEEGPARVRDLLHFGVGFDTVDGEIALALEGAHSVPRVLHARGDATGAEIEHALTRQTLHSPVHVLEHHLLVDLLMEGERCAGAAVIETRRSGSVPLEVRGTHTVLATGGGGHIFEHTTNPPLATADGVAVALRAGAAVADLEFFQFHPTALMLPRAPRFLISEAVRGFGGVLRDSAGERFMLGQHERAELAPRDVVSRAIVEEMTRCGTDHVVLDLTHLDPARVEARFPTIARECARYGVDITRDPIPVAPAAHYMIGGVLTDVWGRTTVDGLYACGEVASAGVHGANRLASNSLLDAVVFGSRIVDACRGNAPPAKGHAAGVTGQAAPERREGTRPAPEGEGGTDGGPVAVEVRAVQFPRARRSGTRSGGDGSEEPFTARRLRRLMWTNVGIERERRDLERACRQLTRWMGEARPPSGRTGWEGANMLLAGWLMATAALARNESRGTHFRRDAPQTRPQWRRRLAYVRVEGAM